MYIWLHLLVCLGLTGSAPEIIAHRGESFDAPENTLAAFRLAWERNVQAIELDVHLTKDGELILCHDKDTERTAGKKLVIHESSLDQLRGLEVGRWKGERWRGEKMPTLDEALAGMPDGTRCFIEIKVGPEAVSPTIRAIQRSGKRLEQLVVISFNADTIAETKRQLPALEAYFLSSFKQDKENGTWKPSVEELIEKAKAIRADGLNLSHQGPIDGESVRLIKSQGLKFFVWTVDDPQVARKYASWGADGITTNRAAWLAPQLLSSSASTK